MGTKTNPDVKKDGTKWRAISVCLIIGMITSFLIFVFCVVLFILRSHDISVSVAAIKNNPYLITHIDIRAFEALQTYYKDESNFSIISLLYVLISSVFIAALGLYIQNQKERLDKFEAQRSDLTNEIEQNKIVVEGIKNTVLKQEKKLCEVDLQYARYTAFQYLGYAQMFAANINTMCNNKDVKSAAVSEYTTIFRDCIHDSHLENSLKTLSSSSSTSKDNKTQIIHIISDIITLLEYAVEKKHPGYTKVVHDEFMERLKYLELLLKAGKKRGRP